MNELHLEFEKAFYYERRTFYDTSFNDKLITRKSYLMPIFRDHNINKEIYSYLTEGYCYLQSLDILLKKGADFIWKKFIWKDKIEMFELFDIAKSCKLNIYYKINNVTWIIDNCKNSREPSRSGLLISGSTCTAARYKYRLENIWERKPIMNIDIHSINYDLADHCWGLEQDSVRIRRAYIAYTQILKGTRKIEQMDCTKKTRNLVEAAIKRYELAEEKTLNKDYVLNENHKKLELKITDRIDRIGLVEEQDEGLICVTKVEEVMAKYNHTDPALGETEGFFLAIPNKPVWKHTYAKGKETMIPKKLVDTMCIKGEFLHTQKDQAIEERMKMTEEELRNLEKDPDRVRFFNLDYVWGKTGGDTITSSEKRRARVDRAEWISNFKRTYIKGKILKETTLKLRNDNYFAILNEDELIQSIDEFCEEPGFEVLKNYREEPEEMMGILRNSTRNKRKNKKHDKAKTEHENILDITKDILDHKTRPKIPMCIYKRYRAIINFHMTGTTVFEYLMKDYAKYRNIIETRINRKKSPGTYIDDDGIFRDERREDFPFYVEYDY